MARAHKHQYVEVGRWPTTDDGHVINTLFSVVYRRGYRVFGECECGDRLSWTVADPAPGTIAAWYAGGALPDYDAGANDA